MMPTRRWCSARCINSRKESRISTRSSNCKKTGGEQHSAASQRSLCFPSASSLTSFFVVCLCVYSYHEILQYHMEHHQSAAILNACSKHGDKVPNLWVQALSYFAAQAEPYEEQIQTVLRSIKDRKLLPPLMILQMLSANPRKELGVVKDFIVSSLAEENHLIEASQEDIHRFQHDTQIMREEIIRLHTQSDTHMHNAVHTRQRIRSRWRVCLISFLCVVVVVFQAHHVPRPQVSPVHERSESAGRSFPVPPLLPRTLPLGLGAGMPEMLTTVQTRWVKHSLPTERSSARPPLRLFPPAHRSSCAIVSLSVFLVRGIRESMKAATSQHDRFFKVRARMRIPSEPRQKPARWLTPSFILNGYVCVFPSVWRKSKMASVWWRIISAKACSNHSQPSPSTQGSSQVREETRRKEIEGAGARTQRARKTSRACSLAQSLQPIQAIAIAFQFLRSRSISRALAGSCRTSNARHDHLALDHVINLTAKMQVYMYVFNRVLLWSRTQRSGRKAQRVARIKARCGCCCCLVEST